MLGISSLNDLGLLAVGYAGAVVIGLWIALVAWVYRDMRARSRDRLARLLITLMVAILTIPGALIYLLLRPRETLAQAYERALEEEALLQEIENKPTCPGCGRQVQSDWMACPYCHTRLKKSCINCNYLLEFAWEVCPSCATVQSQYVPEEEISPATQQQIPEPEELPEDAEIWARKQEEEVRTTPRSIFENPRGY